MVKVRTQLRVPPCTVGSAFWLLYRSFRARVYAHSASSYTWRPPQTLQLQICGGDSRPRESQRALSCALWPRPPDRTLRLSLCGVCVVAMASIHAAKSPSARQRAIVLQPVLYVEMMWSQRTVARCAGWSGGVRAGAHAEWRSCLCSGRRAYSTQWRPRRRLWPHTVLAILPDLMPSTPHGTQQRCSVTPQVATLHTRTAWR